jgi:hypothetical protein
LWDLISFVTFLCVVLAITVSSGPALPIALLNAVIFTAAVFVTGKSLYGWLIGGGLLVALLLSVVIAWRFGSGAQWRQFAPDFSAAVCLGAASGAAVKLGRTHMHWLHVSSIYLATIDLIWLLIRLSHLH